VPADADLAPFGLPPELEARLGDRLRGLVAAIEAETADAQDRAVLGIVPAWATIDLDRAERALAPTNRTHRAADPVLGAHARVSTPDPIGPDPIGGSGIVLLEPSTEGPLAAALARHDEGWVAAYVLITTPRVPGLGRAGIALGAQADGPLGPERLVLGGPRDGPFVLLVQSAPTPSADP
jgi:hypothetical protein